MPYVRTVKTSSGATAVQIVYSYHRGSRKIEHIGSAHDDAGLELLKAVARQRLAAGQEELDLGLERTEPARRGAGGGPLPITSTRMEHLWQALSRGYDELGFGRAAGRDEVFRQLVLARIIEPVSKLDSLRVLEEAGITPVSYATLRRRLPACAKEPWRQGLSAACAAHAGLGPASLVLYDVSTLYFETDAGDGFRESGFSKERRPIYHRKRDPIEAHLTIVFAALAVSRRIEAQTGWSIRKFVKTARRYKTIGIQAGIHTFTAADPLPDDLRDALDRVHHDLSAH